MSKLAALILFSLLTSSMGGSKKTVTPTDPGNENPNGTKIAAANMVKKTNGRQSFVDILTELRDRIALEKEQLNQPGEVGKMEYSEDGRYSYDKGNSMEPDAGFITEKRSDQDDELAKDLLGGVEVAVEAAFLVMDKFTKVEEIVAKAISNVKEEKSERS